MKNKISNVNKNKIILKTTKNIINNIVGKDGIIKPDISKEIWIGNYRINIKIH